jgi:hypothetical protein
LPKRHAVGTPTDIAAPPRRFARKDVTDEQVVEACSHTLGDDSLAHLMAATGAPRKVCLAAMERALRRHLIEYGVCIERAWAVR